VLIFFAIFERGKQKTKTKFFTNSKKTDALLTFQDELPYSIRVLLESAVRNCDNFHILEKDVQNILNWTPGLKQGQNDVEVSFKPARVILQVSEFFVIPFSNEISLNHFIRKDFTGVPAVVDFAAMRDAVLDLGGDPQKINPICPADLVIDHSVQVDFARRY